MQERLFNRYYILIWCSALCLMMIQNLMGSGIPLFLQERGFSTAFSGLLGIPFALFGIPARTAGGYLMDRFSRRSVMIAGTLIMGVSSILFQLFPLAALMLLFRGFHGVGFSMGQAVFSTASVDVTPPAKSRLGVGIFWISTALSIAGAAALLQVLTQRGTCDSIFFCALAFGLVGAVLALLCNYEKKYPIRRETDSDAASQPKGLNKFWEPAAARPAAIEFFTLMGISCCNIFVFSFATNQGYANPSEFLLIGAVSMAVCNLASSGLIKRFGIRNLFAFTMALGGILIALIALVPSQFTYFLGGVGFGIAEGFSFPLLTILAVDDVPPNHRGTANSTMLMAGDIGVGVGTFLWGVLIEYSGYFTAFALSGLVLIWSGILCILFYLRKRQN